MKIKATTIDTSAGMLSSSTITTTTGIDSSSSLLSSRSYNNSNNNSNTKNNSNSKNVNSALSTLEKVLMKFFVDPTEYYTTTEPIEIFDFGNRYEILLLTNNNDNNNNKPDEFIIRLRVYLRYYYDNIDNDNDNDNKLLEQQLVSYLQTLYQKATVTTVEEEGEDGNDKSDIILQIDVPRIPNNSCNFVESCCCNNICNNDCYFADYAHRLAQVRVHALGFPIIRALEKLKKRSFSSSSPSNTTTTNNDTNCFSCWSMSLPIHRILNGRKWGSCCLFVTLEKVMVLYSVDYEDKMECALARLFLQQFAGEQKQNSKMTTCLGHIDFRRSNDPPQELKDLLLRQQQQRKRNSSDNNNIDKNCNNIETTRATTTDSSRNSGSSTTTTTTTTTFGGAGTLSFTFFSSHLQQEKQQNDSDNHSSIFNTANKLVNFFVYLDQSIKSSKTYMNIRMRQKKDDLLQEWKELLQHNLDAKKQQQKQPRSPQPQKQQQQQQQQQPSYQDRRTNRNTGNNNNRTNITTTGNNNNFNNYNDNNNHYSRYNSSSGNSVNNKIPGVIGAKVKNQSAFVRNNNKMTTTTTITTTSVRDRIQLLHTYKNNKNKS